MKEMNKFEQQFFVFLDDPAYFEEHVKVKRLVLYQNYLFLHYDNLNYRKISKHKFWINLEKLIMDRYSILKSSTINSILQIATKIGEELLLISTPFDCEFNHECNRILSNIEKDDQKRNRNIKRRILFYSISVLLHLSAELAAFFKLIFVDKFIKLCMNVVNCICIYLENYLIH